MRIHGHTIAEIARDEEGNTLRRSQMPLGVLSIAEGVNLQFCVELFGLFSYADKGRTEKYTRDYTDWVHLARERFHRPDWTKQKLLKCRKWAIGIGLLVPQDNGDFMIDVSVIPKERIEQRTTTARRSTSAPAQAEAIERKEPQPQPALTASEAPAINATPLQVIEDIERQMEPQHVRADRKPMHYTPSRRQFFEDPYDALPRSTGDSFAAWEARQQAEMNEFKRSTQEPEPPAAEEPDQALEQELSEFMKKKLGIGVLTKRERDELIQEQEMATESSYEPAYLNDIEQW